MDKPKCRGCKQAREHVEDTLLTWTCHTCKFATEQDQKICRA